MFWGPPPKIPKIYTPRLCDFEPSRDLSVTATTLAL
eukprot:COSAG05_NODE_22729_length_263_cov_0.213415_1_plen_35_part_01